MAGLQKSSRAWAGWSGQWYFVCFISLIVERPSNGTVTMKQQSLKAIGGNFMSNAFEPWRLIVGNFARALIPPPPHKPARKYAPRSMSVERLSIRAMMAADTTQPFYGPVQESLDSQANSLSPSISASANAARSIHFQSGYTGQSTTANSIATPIVTDEVFHRGMVPTMPIALTPTPTESLARARYFPSNGSAIYIPRPGNFGRP